MRVFFDVRPYVTPSAQEPSPYSAARSRQDHGTRRTSGEQGTLLIPSRRRETGTAAGQRGKQSVATFRSRSGSSSGAPPARRVPPGWRFRLRRLT
jgi:hypothetical protein